MSDAPRPIDPRQSPWGLAAGIFGGFGLLALVNAVAIAVTVPMPLSGSWLRLEHHLFDALETLGVGAVVAAVVGGFVGLSRLPEWAMRAVGFLAALAMVWAVIGEYLALQVAHLMSGRFELPVQIVAFALLGTSFVEGPAVAAAAAGTKGRRWVPAVFGAALMIADHVPLRDDYAGIHGLIAFGAALVAGPSFGALVLAAGQRLARRSSGRAALLGIALVLVMGLVWPPANSVRFELFRQPCAVAPWILATTVWREPSVHAPIPAPVSPWLMDRSSAPAVRPTTPQLASNPVVVLITIDALRADVVSTTEHDKLIPTLADLRTGGVVFTHASTPGTQTPLSLSTMFSGLYFSQQRWANYGSGFDRFPYPAADAFPRFPEILAAGGVLTVQESAYVFLAGPFGVTRGFTEEHIFGESRAAAPANRLVGALIERLGTVGDQPVFAYAHLAEPHAPYRLGHKGDDDYHRYLTSVGVADAQLARVQRFLGEHFDDRWILIVSADHGEAFGEHQTRDHSKTLYEELLHVPLIVRSPLLSPRAVDQRVGLVDLGPTILDLFGMDTPATFNGQSLVPLLTGHDVALSRPLLAEGRLRTAITEPDGFKVIRDPRRKLVEAYDLAADPAETRNVFDLEPARADHALSLLRAFFAARTLDGYEPPYKP